MDKNDYEIFDIFDKYTDEENHQRMILIIERLKDNTLFCVMLRDTGLIYIMQDDDNYTIPASKEEKKTILNITKDFIKIIKNKIKEYSTMENLLNINPTTDYKIRQESNCPEKNSCIGFSRAVQTPNGIKPCTTVYKCPFNQDRMYKWDTPPR